MKASRDSPKSRSWPAGRWNSPGARGCRAPGRPAARRCPGSGPACRRRCPGSRRSRARGRRTA
eukprot:7780616-Alexandrium_andersonii.AAC.1